MAVAARTYLLLGVLAIALYVGLGGAGWAYQAFSQASWIAVAIGVLANRPRTRGWYLVGAYAALLGAGDVFFFGLDHGSPTFPSAADFFYMAGDVFLAFGLTTLVRRRDSVGRDLLSLGDSFVLALAVALVLWSAFLADGLGPSTGLARTVTIAHTTLDLLLLTIVVRLLLTVGRRTTSFWYLVAAVSLLVVFDASYIVPALSHSYIPGSWRDSGWLASYVLCGAAALHPSMTVFVERRRDALPVWRVALLGSSLFLVAVAVIARQALHGQVDVYDYAGVSGVMAVFITLRIVGLVRTLEDTRRLAIASERRFRMVFEHSPIGISVGRDGVMEETNPALQRMLGYSGEELARMHYTDVTHPDDRALSVQSELDEGHRHAFSIDKRYQRRDGMALDTHVNVALDVEDGFGISIIEDVTVRRGLEDQLRQSQKMEAVGKLAGGIAHDFNNLMTAVIGYSDLLLRGLDEDPRAEKVEAIRQSAVRASDLTRQLLAFSRRQVLQPDELDLRDVVDELDSLLRRLIGEDVILDTLYGSEPVVVRADKTQLEQVVVNLAVNARDAMPTGGTLTIAVVSDGREAALTVSDTGVGMDEETRARIFEPFFTTKPLAESSGLGLSTVHGIVGQSGGRIDVQTAPGGGSVFTVRLPLAALREPAAVATLVD